MEISAEIFLEQNHSYAHPILDLNLALGSFHLTVI